MEIEEIGVVRTCFGGKFAVPRQPGLVPSAWGELQFHPPYRNREAVRGLEGFSHVWLLFGFHQTREQGWSPTVRPPRMGGNRRIGVFASRSTFRPNGLGLSLVRLEAVDLDAPGAPLLRLGGLDLIDGTPIFDIKPYLPYAEALPEATAGYAAGEIPRLHVVVAEPAAADFAALPERAQAVIRECLALDPRPPAGAGDHERVYGADLCGKNVRFRIAEGRCEILSIATPDETAQG
jgi:tRNA (adenine37-N6)-methyltransferase